MFWVSQLFESFKSVDTLEISQFLDTQKT